MGAEVSIDVYGVRDALRELGAIDKTLRFKAQARIKAASKPLADEGRAAYPETNEIKDNLKGWSAGGRLGYDKVRVDKGVQVKIGGRSYGNAYAIVTLVQQDPGGALFDIAGLNNGSSGNPDGPDRKGRKRQRIQSEAFLNALKYEFGPAQRGLWRRQRKIREMATEELLQALRDVTSMVNKRLVES